MSAYFQKNDMPIKNPGLLVIPVNDSQHERLLDMYEKRQKLCKQSVQMIGYEKAKKIATEIR
jgi:hypothetical protein